MNDRCATCGEIHHDNVNARVDFHLLRGLVQRGLSTFGEFALFWNQDLDAVSRHGKDRGEALRRHADMVCDVVKTCLPRRELTSDMLLPEGSEAMINAGFAGTLGAFEIYRGAGCTICQARSRRMLRPRRIRPSSGR
jgi:hypothetical protein